MLRGSEKATVDDKGRLKIPVLFLPELRKQGDLFYVTSDRGDHAKLYPMAAWEAIEEKLAKLPSFHPTRRKFLALTSYYGHETKIDGQGRILIPAILRDAAQMQGEVMVVTEQDHLEVWNHRRFVERWGPNPWTEDDDKHLGELGI
jgi:MraZ protein